MGSHVSLAGITGGNYKIQEILMSLFQLGPMMFGGTSGIISFLQSKHLLAAQKQCACGTAMELQDRKDINDGCRWCCPHCNKRITIRDGSFFEKSKLTLQKWLILIYWWARQYPVTDAAEEAEVTKATAIQVLKYYYYFHCYEYTEPRKAGLV